MASSLIRVAGGRAASSAQRLILGVVTLAAVGVPFGIARVVTAEHHYPPPGLEVISATLDRGTIASADLILANTWQVGRSAPAHLPQELTWTEDPYNDAYWRLGFYSLRPIQDLLWAWYETGNGAYRDKLIDVLRSFLRTGVHSKMVVDNPDLHIPAWRTMVLVNTYVKLVASRDLPEDLAAALREYIRSEGRFLADPANFEQRFNHGVNQTAALLLVAHNFPDFPESNGWSTLATGRLESLLDQIVDPDGVEIENSPYYHFYVLNALSEIADWSQRNGLTISSKLAATIDRMVRYASYITMPNGQIPLVGASTELDVSEYKPSLLDTLARHNPTLAYVRSAGRVGTPPNATALFASSGTAILRSELPPGAAMTDQTWAMLDVGPWRTEHSHLNRLGLVLYSGGRVLLPDSGLFQYAPQEASNYYDTDYFYSTAAHNTVVVDGMNQSREGPVGPGLTAQGAEWRYQSGWHQLYPGVTHRRALVLLRQDVVLIVDELEGPGTHSFAQTWHLMPDLALSSGGLDAFGSDANGRRVVAIHQAPSDGITLQTSATGDVPSFYSETYGKKEASQAVSYTASGTHATFFTLITAGRIADEAASVAGSRLRRNHRGKGLRSGQRHPGHYRSFGWSRRIDPGRVRAPSMSAGGRCPLRHVDAAREGCGGPGPHNVRGRGGRRSGHRARRFPREREADRISGQSTVPDQLEFHERS